MGNSSTADLALTFSHRAHGCILGGAIGDALGAPVEFMSRREILALYGADGIADPDCAGDGAARITDDTQMTLFTAEALIRASKREAVLSLSTLQAEFGLAYRRWYLTQGEGRPEHPVDDDLSGLYQTDALHRRCAPGITCLTALEQFNPLSAGASNQSKGCGGVMRVAPIGLYFAAAYRTENDRPRIEMAFDAGVMAAAVTHGHPTGQLSAGAMASIIYALAYGQPLMVAIERTLDYLKTWPAHEETLAAISDAVLLGEKRPNLPEALALLGQGWVAEEALAIGIYCALSEGSFEDRLRLAVNHDGDSDSTGSIAGQLMGAMHGTSIIPPHWSERVEMNELMQDMASDLGSSSYAGELGSLSNAELTLQDLPTHEVPASAILEFARTFNAYKVLGSFELCGDIANERRHATLTDLRTCLFFEQRRWHHYGMLPDAEALAYHRELIDMIRVKIAANERL